LRATDLFRILESFLEVINPQEWKQRSLNHVPLGDMPLRTIKVLIQHIHGQSVRGHTLRVPAQMIHVVFLQAY
jgi:hypothetical protein